MYQSLKNAARQYGVGTIDIGKAHIWWDFPDDKGNAGVFRVFELGSPEDREFEMAQRSGLRPIRDTGACVLKWNQQSIDSLLEEICQMVVELSCRGVPTNEVVRELAQIQEFAALGASSYYMARALSTALTGCAYDNLEFWERYVNDDEE